MLESFKYHEIRFGSNVIPICSRYIFKKANKNFKINYVSCCRANKHCIFLFIWLRIIAYFVLNVYFWNISCKSHAILPWNLPYSSIYRTHSSSKELGSKNWVRLMSGYRLFYLHFRFFRSCWNNLIHFAFGNNFSPAGRIKGELTVEEVCTCVKRFWNNIEIEIIVKSFKRLTFQMLYRKLRMRQYMKSVVRRRG